MAPRVIPGYRTNGTRGVGSGSRGEIPLPVPRFRPEDVTSDAREAWQACLSEVQAKSAELRDCATNYWEIWFRGQPHRSYPLMPSLFRGYPAPNSSDTWQHIWGKEQDLYWEFSTRARELHTVVEEDWDILFAMQHYGAPTRLLDWTETLAVGVYFALHRFSGVPGEPVAIDASDPPCLWLLNPYELNTTGIGKGKSRDLFDPKNLGWDEELREYFGYSDLFLEGKLDWSYPIAVYPRQRTTRMQVQRGWFTIHGDEYVPLDQLKQNRGFLRSVVIPPEAEPGAREFLHCAGMELFTLFPDLQNLAAWLGRKSSENRADFLADAGR